MGKNMIFNKKVMLFGILFFFFPIFLVYPVEVSEKKDIAIFGITFYSGNVPEELLGYAGSSINHVFINLKRFNVYGYDDYRMHKGDIDEFIQRIKELRAEKAKQAGTFDEKFGTVIIKGEDFSRIVNSFLVVIPSLSSYTIERKKTEVVSGSTTYVKYTYEVNLVIDLEFINIEEGTREESIRVTGTGSSHDLHMAGRNAIDTAVSILSYRIKQLEAFRIKSGVIKRRGDTIIFELGKNMGVHPGDEYEVMTKQQIGSTERIVELPTGLVRVKKVYFDISEARVVYQKERITEGDQLVEVARLGAQLSLSAGVMKVDIPDMSYDIILIGDTYSGIFNISSDAYYYISLDQKEVKYSPNVGIRITKNLGYRFKGVFDGVAMLNFPLFGGIGELGVGTSFYRRRLSLDLLAQGGFLYMTTFSRDLKPKNFIDKLFTSLNIEGTKIDYNQYPVVSIYGVSAGVKGGAGLTYLIKPNISLRTAINYRLYTPIKNWRIKIEETSGKVMDSVTISSDSEHIYEVEGGMKRVNISGYEVNFSLNLRF